jgi:hypothetical protein
MLIRVAFTLAAALMVCSCGSSQPEPEKRAVEGLAKNADADAAAVDGSTAMLSETSGEDSSEKNFLSGPQANAARSAQQYLAMSGFSRDGLIEQLSSEFGDGYSVADATRAVDNLSVDWNENAAKSASQYLSISGFSCDGLIEQLSSSYGDRYTVDQATYGARQAGAC